MSDIEPASQGLQLEPMPPTTGEQLRQRNAWLEQSLDPDSSLPAVDLVLLDGHMSRCVDGVLPPDVPFDGNAGSLYMTEPGTSETIGDVVYGKDELVPDKLVITDLSILDSAQGRGYGRRLYLEALKALPLGHGLVCHSNLSDDARKVWEWLVSAGVARQRQEPSGGQLGGYETIF